MGRPVCDTVLYNGKIVTVDRDFSFAEAVAIAGNKFVQSGPNDSIRSLAGSNAKEIDLKGKMVLPGLIDTHPHVIIFGIVREGILSLAGLTSIRAIKERIAEKVRESSSGAWIVTAPVGNPPDFFHLPQSLEEKRWPTRWDLDEVSPHNPVYVTAPISWAPHPAVLNSYALRELGITKDTHSEEGGTEIVKDAESGEPNGQLHRMHFWNYGELYKKLMRMLPRPSHNEMIRGLRSVFRDFSAVGVTTGYEGHMTGPEQLLLLKELWAKEELTMRVYFAYEIDKGRSLRELEIWMKDIAHATSSGFGDDMLRIGGITASIDGPSQLGVSVMNRPYRDPFGKMTTGIQQIATDQLNELCVLAAKHHLRMNIQTGGDKANDIALEAYERADKIDSIKDKLWVLQHIQHPSSENIMKCKELGVAVTTVSSFEFSKGLETYRERLGGDYWERAVPLRDWIDAGILVAQGTDGAHYNPMFTIWNSLARVDGRTGESMMTPHKKITREEAIRLYTINGARVLFWEDKIGSIEPGKLADLVVLDRDILDCPLEEIRGTRVLMTMLGGKIIYQA